VYENFGAQIIILVELTLVVRYPFETRGRRQHPMCSPGMLVHPPKQPGLQQNSSTCHATNLAHFYSFESPKKGASPAPFLTAQKGGNPIFCFSLSIFMRQMANAN